MTKRSGEKRNYRWIVATFSNDNFYAYGRERVKNLIDVTKLYFVIFLFFYLEFISNDNFCIIITSKMFVVRRKNNEEKRKPIRRKTTG